ncbi:hypothetical protein ACVWYH_006013 [Bradyrhizobium sp. GM24.11]
MPASALPVAIASRSCSVEPPKLMKSTSRLCFAKTPRSFATGAAAVQTDVAFHASVSARGGPDNPSLGIAVRQKGSSSGRGALFSAVSARATVTVASGAATPKAPARPRTVRRERQGRVGSRGSVVRFLRLLSFSMIIIPGQAFIETWQQKTVVWPGSSWPHCSAERRRRYSKLAGKHAAIVGPRPMHNCTVIPCRGGIELNYGSKAPENLCCRRRTGHRIESRGSPAHWTACTFATNR